MEVARESERGIVDIETLKATNENLIQTFDEVMKIQAEGRAKRAEAEVEMRRMEAELRQKLLEVRYACAFWPLISGKCAWGWP